MRAMVRPRPGLPLEPRDVRLPEPGPGEILLRVVAREALGAG
jgi:NADPH:quinone reductase-like Zn-dependent oxidoreductase